MMSKTIYFIAGEQSGDVLGSQLIASLRKKIPNLACYGVGGSQMHQSGLSQSVATIDQFHVMGFADVIFAFPKFFKLFRRIKKDILSKKPEAVIFIDYPEFNMMLARSLRKSGYTGKLIHYVCPSVWAWRKNRIKKLANRLDLLISILPFEKSYFSKTSLKVAYVGHPLVAMLRDHVYAKDWRLECGDQNSNKPILAVFPGSRENEITNNLPLQLEAASKFIEAHPNFVSAISVARPQLESSIRRIAARFSIPHFFVPPHLRYELMHGSNLVLATSGTVILELGLHHKPTVATYRLPWLNYILGRYLFRIHLRFYTLVNIILQREVFPEFIHRNITVSDLVCALEKIYNNEEFYRSECHKLRKILSTQNASQIAAAAISNVIF